MDRVLRVGEEAREPRRSSEWLREAERKGKIPRARRDLNGWRAYTEEDIERLRRVLLPRFDSEAAPCDC